MFLLFPLQTKLPSPGDAQAVTALPPLGRFLPACLKTTFVALGTKKPREGFYSWSYGFVMKS